jgi:hypothetical protein
MRKVTVKVESTTDNPIDAEVRVEARRDASAPFSVQRSYAITSGMQDSTREFLLADNDRIVIEPRGQIELVYDREQGVARTVLADRTDELKDPNARAAIEAEHAVEREARSKDLTPEMLKEQQVAQAKANEEAAEKLRVMREKQVEKAKAVPSVAEQKANEERTIAPGVSARPQMRGDPNVPTRPFVPPKPVSTSGPMGVGSTKPVDGAKSSEDVKK